MNPYPHEDRARARMLVKRIEDMRARCELMAKGEIAPNAELIAGIAGFTGASDADQQLKALDTFSTGHAKAHMDRLVELAPNDLTAFAEVMSPHEPPARHHIYIAERMMEVESGERDRLMLSMPPGHAKDLDVETSITMADGTQKRLGDIVQGDMVISHEGRPCEVLATHDQGVRPVMRIFTRSGRVTRPHKEHVYLAAHGWTEAGDLQVGDELLVPREIETLHPSLIEPPPGGPKTRPCRDAFIFAGYMLARACVSGRSYNRLHRISRQFRADDPAIIADFLECTARLKFQTTATRTQKLYERSATTITLCTRAKLFLMEHGLWDEQKLDLTIPDWVFAGDEGDVCAFLGAIVSCDATLRPCANKHHGRAKKLAMRIRKNRPLARQLQQLFTRAGIMTSLRTSNCTNVNYRATTFFFVEIEEAASQMLVARRLRLRGMNKRFWDLPIAGVRLGNDKFHADPIVEIVADDGECETRCLTVETDSSFLAEDLCVHNSTYCSRYYPAWYLGRAENRIYLQAGFSKPFATTEFGAKTRDLCMTEAYRRVFPGLMVRSDRRAMADWVLTNGNRYVAKGVGEGISGFRSTNNGVDDPYANYEAAQSPGIRKKVWDWFVNDYMTRLLPQGNAFIIATRWHVDDLIGHIEELIGLGEISDPWVVINLPVFGDGSPDQPFFRHFLEPLWPDFYTSATLLKQKELMSTSNWACLYEGKPLPADGNIIKSKWLTNRWITYPNVKAGPHAQSTLAAEKVQAEHQLKNAVQPDKTTKIGELDMTLLNRGSQAAYRRTILSVDSAEKDTDRADYSAITAWREGLDSMHYMVFAMRERMEFPRLIEAIDEVAAMFGADVVLMEEKGAGNQYIQHCKSLTGEPGSEDARKSFEVIGVNPGRDGKTFRMDSVTPIIRAGRMVLPLKAPWLDALERELLQFPGGKHDDFADTVSQYLKWARDQTSTRGAATRQLKLHGRGSGGGSGRDKVRRQIEDRMRREAQQNAGSREALQKVG